MDEKKLDEKAQAYANVQRSPNGIHVNDELSIAYIAGFRAGEVEGRANRQETPPEEPPPAAARVA